MEDQNKPLKEIRIISTRATHQAGKFKKGLQKYGAEVISIPTIEISEPDNWQPFDEAAKQLGNFDWLLFTSVNAVSKTMERLEKLSISKDKLSNLKIAVVGDQTGKSVEKYGLNFELIPKVYQGEGLLDAFSGYDLKNKKIWFPRAMEARNLLLKGLKEQGAEVILTAVYQTGTAKNNSQKLIECLKNEEANWVAFTSSSTAENFLELLGDERKNLNLPKVASIGTLTTETLLNAGIEPEFTANPQNLDGLLEGLINWIKNNPA